MRIFILGILLLIEMIIESTIFPFMQIKGATPNIVLITIISIGLIFGRKEGVTLGLIGGLLYDILFGRVLGLHALSFMLIGYLMGLASERVYKENRLIPFIFTIIGTLSFHGIFYLLQYLLGVEFLIIMYLKNFTGISLILNSILIIFAYPLILRLSNWNVLKEK